jgi:hypothetical protein
MQVMINDPRVLWQCHGIAFLLSTAQQNRLCCRQEIVSAGLDRISWRFSAIFSDFFVRLRD